MSKRNRTSSQVFVYGILGVLLLTAADQITKFLAVKYLKDTSGVVLLPGVFELVYLENRGAAWGMMYGMQWILLTLTAVTLIAVIFLYIKAPIGRRYRAMRILCVVFTAGTIGNALDRLMHGFVIDFFYISLIDFPVFNVADCFICISIALFLLLYWKEDFLWMKKS